MSDRLKRYAPILAAVLLTCGKDSAAPLPDEPGPPTDVAGLWSYTAYLENTDRQIECHDEGRITISQDSADLTGPVTQAGSCNSEEGYFEYSGTGTLSGNVGAATVRLAFEGCSYHGDLFNTPRDSAGGTVTCTITGPLPVGRLSLTGTWFAIKGIEAQPPELTATIVWPPGDQQYFVTGETFRLAIRASDDRKLHSVVYNIGPPMNLYDSVFTTDTVFTDTVEVVVPASWDGEADVLVRAHDAGGGGQFQNIGTLRVLNGIRRPFQSRNLIARAAGAVYDSTRNVLYVAQPESAQVGVLSLGSMTLGPRIHLPTAAVGYGTLGIDIVPGGDTVVVPLPDSGRIALLNRVSGTTTTVPIAGGLGATNLVVTSNRHVFALGSRDSAGFLFFGIVDHDLATGTDTLRRDVGQNGHLNATAQLFRSPDQSKVFVYSVGAPTCGYVYDVATDSFSACQTFGVAGDAVASATTNGSKWLWGNLLLDSALNVIATVPSLTGPWPPVPMFPGIAPDGSVAYIPTTYGYDKVALPAGTVLERVRAYYWPYGLTRATVFAEGTRLLLWSDLQHGMPGMYRAIVVDLTP